MNKFLEELETNMQNNCFCEEVKKVNLCEIKQEYKKTAKLPENVVTAMAYVPFQTCIKVYSPDEALCHGTLFPNIYKPFFGGKCV